MEPVEVQDDEDGDQSDDQPSALSSSSDGGLSETPSVSGGGDAVNHLDEVEPILRRTRQQTHALLQQRPEQRLQQRVPNLREREGDHSALWTATEDLWATERILAQLAGTEDPRNQGSLSWSQSLT